MSKDRNRRCDCGSGKKYKHCCLMKDSGVAQMPTALPASAGGIWYHGSDTSFKNWKFPPPPKPGQPLLMRHTAVFLTSDFDFAKGAGRMVAKATVSPSAKVLDVALDYSGAELLRRKLCDDPFLGLSENVSHDWWHTGWITGDVLRLAYQSLGMERILQTKILALVRRGIPLAAANEAVGLNSARELIERICANARTMGYDAIVGREVDRHSYPGRIIAQPWLAVLRPKIVSAPNWLP